MVARDGTQKVAQDIVGRIARRHSTATVLFHHAVAERLGLGATDHKCLDLLRERPGITASEVAAATGLTTGAVTGVVTRLERAGFLRREPDPNDRRKQVLSPVESRVRDIHETLAPLRNDMLALLKEFGAPELSAIALFLERATELSRWHATMLRAEALHAAQG